jgi:oligopeptide/dipeptide ABC transporter ATP-binding protein
MSKKIKKLHVENLAVSFRTNQGLVQAVRGIDFELFEGETLAIVGESGSGKSVSSRTIMGILASNGFIKSGKIIYEGQDLTKVDEEHFHELRGNKIGMIFQDPMSSLNPIMRIGKQITEGMILNGKRLRDKEKNIYKEQENIYRELFNDEKTLKENFKNFKKNYKNAVRYGMNDIKKDYDDQIDTLEKQIDFDIFEAKNQIRFNKLDIAKFKKQLKDSNSSSRQDELQKTIDQHYQNIVNIKEDIVNFKHQLKTERAQLKAEKAEKVKAFKISKMAERKAVNEKIAEVKQQYSDPEALKEELAKVSEYHRSLYEFQDNMAELKAKVPVAKATYLKAKKEAKVQVKAYWKEEKAKAKAEIQKIREERKNSTTREEDLQAKKDAVEKVKSDIHQLKQKLNEDLSSTVINAEKDIFKKQYEYDLNELNAKLAQAKRELKIQRTVFLHRINEVKENLKRIKKVTKREAQERAIKIMKEVGIPQPEKRFRQYPFQFSGGMRQRIVIAIALTANPDVLICDEPTTALDVTIQAQILELINDLKVKRNLSVIFITHDLGVVANMADRIAVMYAGKIVEIGTAEDIFYNPKHPYTWALLSSMPDINTKERLIAIPGTPPNMLFPPKGDAFADRNQQYAMKIDFEKQPPMFKISETHSAATWLLHKDAPKVEMPEIVKKRIERMLDNDKEGVEAK